MECNLLEYKYNPQPSQCNDKYFNMYMSNSGSIPTRGAIWRSGFKTKLPWHKSL